MDTVFTYVIFFGILLACVIPYLRRMRQKEASALEAAARGGLSSAGPRAQHPHIDISKCIGCGACAEACPVEAITIVMADPSIASDLPALTVEYETNVPNLFIIGELGGLALIKNAVNQGRACIDTIDRRLNRAGGRQPAPGVFDVCIVGAGPGGIAASLRAIENKLSYVTLEQDEFGGTIAKFPRQKLVMTSPVEFPGYGKFNKLEISKEELLAFWSKLGKRSDLKVRTNEKVDGVTRGPDGRFTIVTSKGECRARTVVLALGRRGTPRKLGVKGEHLSKVMYSLIEAEAYTGNRILVIGGGDSAVEAAMGLAIQKGNTVTLSYRQEAFARIKERNAQRIKECIRKGTVRVLFNSTPIEIRPAAVVLEVDGRAREIPNDYAFVFAGGTSPNEFLEKCGVKIGSRDLTKEARAEAKLKGVAA